MKKSLLAFSALFVAGTSFSQIIVSEDFEGITAPAIPATWSQTTLATDGDLKVELLLLSQVNHFLYPQLTQQKCWLQMMTDVTVIKVQTD